MIPQMAVVADPTTREDELSLIPHDTVGKCHGGRLPSVHTSNKRLSAEKDSGAHSV